MVLLCFTVLCIQIVAEWQGDFATNAYFTNFGTKYLLVPDWRLATLLGRGQEFIERAKKHPQVLVRNLHASFVGIVGYQVLFA